MENLNFTKGDIVISAIKGFHPIIYISGHTFDTFEGAIITHSSSFGNLLMNRSHFDEAQKEYLHFDSSNPSYLVRARLIKPKKSWGKFKQIGRLTKAGLSFVEEGIKDKQLLTWEEYRRRQRTT